VNIQTEKFRRQGQGPAPGLPFGGGGPAGRGFETVGIGSGVIIDKDKGYIVTNNHVIAGADRVTVRLSRGGEVQARIVGADPATDLAVLQIKADLKVDAAWGDSNKVAPGDWVLAIGSPFMLDHTVTAGIVSATGRNNLPGMDDNAYQDFIQTDAAINPGNSGGPLIDLNGKVIGINTAILTAGSFLRGDDGMRLSGGFEGIGLAIPSAMAKRVAEGLIKNGKVARGYLGVAIQPLNEALAKSFNVPDGRGTLINGVQPGTPAAKAGLRQGDVIIKVDGQETPDPATLRARTASIAPGSEIQLDYIRDGKPQTLKLVVGEQTALAMMPAEGSFGLRVREIPAGDEEGEKQPSVIIETVVQGSPAARAGLVPSLKILAVGRTEVHTKEEFDKAAAQFTPEQGLPLRVQIPNGPSTFITVGGRR
jgi:serine protease Do